MLLFIRNVIIRIIDVFIILCNLIKHIETPVFAFNYEKPELKKVNYKV